MSLARMVKFNYPYDDEVRLYENLAAGKAYLGFKQVIESMRDVLAISTDNYGISGYAKPKEGNISKFEQNDCFIIGLECKLDTQGQSKKIEFETAMLHSIDIYALKNSLSALESKAKAYMDRNNVTKALAERFYIYSKGNDSEFDSRKSDSFVLSFNLENLVYKFKTYNKAIMYDPMVIAEIQAKNPFNNNEKSTVYKFIDSLIHQGYNVIGINTKLKEEAKKALVSSALKRLLRSSQLKDYFNEGSLPSIPKKLDDKKIKKILPDYLVSLNRLEIVIDREKKRYADSERHVEKLKQIHSETMEKAEKLERDFENARSSYRHFEREVHSIDASSSEQERLDSESKLIAMVKDLERVEHSKSRHAIHASKLKKSILFCEEELKLLEINLDDYGLLRDNMKHNLRAIDLYYKYSKNKDKDVGDIIKDIFDTDSTDFEDDFNL